MKRGAVVGFVLVLTLLMSVFPKSILPVARAVPDVAVTIVAPSKTVVGQGYSLNVTVTVADLGDYPETFNVTVYANTTVVGTHTVKNLLNGTSNRLSSSWNTRGFAKGNYTISAYARPLAGETNLANNNFTSSTAVMVTILPADLIPPFGAIDMKDIAHVAKRFNTDPSNPLWDPNADFDDSGKIDMKDIALVAAHAFTYASVVSSQLKGFSLFIRFATAASAQAGGFPFSYMSEADWAAWNAWHTKDLFADNAFWMDQDLLFNMWSQDPASPLRAALIQRLNAAKIKHIYLQSYAFRDNATHVLQDRYVEQIPMPAGYVKDFVDYVHAHSTMTVIAWGWFAETVSIHSDAYRQQMMSQIVTLVNKYGFDGAFDDSENLVSPNTSADLAAYWNLLGTTFPLSFVAVSEWHKATVCPYVTTLDFMELMDYYDRPQAIPVYIEWMDQALRLFGSPALWGMHGCQGSTYTDAQGNLQHSPSITEQMAAIDAYLGITPRVLGSISWIYHNLE